MICIFDCETIPDVKLVKKSFEIDGSDLEVSNEAFKLQEEKTKSSFLPLPYHQVVAISAVICDDFGRFKKVSSIDGDNEKEMIKNFLSFIDKHSPKLVSFNGRSFDMPMLMIRAMKYNLSCPAYYEVDNKMLNKSKWDNYRYRFSDRFHVDLMDHISEFGAARGLNLNTLCTMMDPSSCIGCLGLILLPLQTQIYDPSNPHEIYLKNGICSCPIYFCLASCYLLHSRQDKRDYTS